MSQSRVVTVLIGVVKPELADRLGVALADGERLRLLESDILAAFERAAFGAVSLADANGGGGPRRDAGSARDLTPRETEVLELLLKGNTDQEIADELTISVGTVHTHVTRIFGKLEVHSRRELPGIQAINPKSPLG
jgi:DNA-binding NarL/FixJ family response regulator